MAVRQPPIQYIERTRDQYSALGYGEYAWVHEPQTPPFTSLRVPMSEARLGLVASGGIYRHGQTAFTFKDDTTYRAISTDVDPSELRATHFAYDLTDTRRDINCVFPIETLRDLVASGEVGSLATDFFTCMGGIYSTRRVREELAPSIVQRCLDDAVDALLLVPV